MADTVRLSLDEAHELCERAAAAAGASPAMATSLARASVAAEADGQPSVGLSHLIDYLDALASGRIDGRAVPTIDRPAPAMMRSDALGGAAHTGFDAAFEDLAQAAEQFGIALFSQHNAYTAGALGYFTGRLAERGLVAIAATNGPALVAGSGTTKATYCTNPLAFSAPVAGGPPLTIDQASSATAFVNIREAARRGETIPVGWALDEDGNPTTDAAKAVKGVLLAFGGARGANIALMVEILSAGVTGANWSLDAPWFGGSTSPGVGLLVIALAPRLLDAGFAERMAVQLERLAELGVHIPGVRKAEANRRAAAEGVTVSRGVYERLAGR